MGDEGQLKDKIGFSRVFQSTHKGMVCSLTEENYG